MMATLRSDMNTPKKPAAGPSGTRGAAVYLPARGGRSHEVRSGGGSIRSHPTPAPVGADPPLRGGIDHAARRPHGRKRKPFGIASPTSSISPSVSEVMRPTSLPAASTTPTAGARLGRAEAQGP